MHGFTEPAGIILIQLRRCLANSAFSCRILMPAAVQVPDLFRAVSGRFILRHPAAQAFEYLCIAPGGFILQIIGTRFLHTQGNIKADIEFLQEEVVKLFLQVPDRLFCLFRIRGKNVAMSPARIDQVCPGKIQMLQDLIDHMFHHDLQIEGP